jgi:hypothetical protein
MDALSGLEVARLHECPTIDVLAARLRCVTSCDVLNYTLIERQDRRAVDRGISLMGDEIFDLSVMSSNPKIT